MPFLEFTRPAGQKINIQSDHIIGFYADEHDRGTVILTASPILVAIKETYEEVVDKIAANIVRLGFNTRRQ